jgi:pyrimidine-specific ribonucleoside hydrolase
VRLPVILDADIGGEPDDAMALVIAARELPELALVVTSDEMSGQRARYARLLLDAAGRPDVPVVAGRQLSATPCFFAAGLTPGSVAAQPDDVAAAVHAACGRAGGVARWVGLGPLSNLAALLSQEPGLARRLFITQLTGTVNRADPALPPRNFRLDPGAARQVLTAARYLRLVRFDTAGRPGCEITAATPVFRELARAAGAPAPPWTGAGAPPWTGAGGPPWTGAPASLWAGLLAAHCRQFFARYHPAVLPAGPLALSAALRFPFTSFAWAVLTADAAGRLSERRAGRAMLLSQDSDYPALARWLQARLDPRPQPRARRQRVVPAAASPARGYPVPAAPAAGYPPRAGPSPAPIWNQTVVPALP